jgi:uncharacterized protein
VLTEGEGERVSREGRRSPVGLTPPRRAARLARLAFSSPIIVYQRLISPALPRRCKYEPTCSRYAVQAIGEYGILRGSVLAVWRVLRCNPWSRGGFDPVRKQRLFRMGRMGPETEAHARH